MLDRATIGIIGAALFILIGFSAWKVSAEQASTEQDFSTFREFLDHNIESGEFDCQLESFDEKILCMTHQGAIFDLDLFRHPDASDRSVIYKGRWDALFDALVSIKLMSVVNEVVSTSRYGFLASRKGFAQPSLDPNIFMDEGYGICGNQAGVMNHLLNRYGLMSRTVQFFGRDEYGEFSHIAVEVLIGDEWAYFDPTWNRFFRNGEKIASTRDLVSNSGFEVFGDRTNLRTSIIDRWGHLSQSASIIYGFDSGTVNIEKYRLKNGVVSFSNIPNYIGDNVGDGDFAGVEHQLPDFGMEYLELKFSGVGGCISETARICVGAQCKRIDREGVIFNAVDRGSRMRIESEGEEVCYAVLETVRYGE